jgi:hypothetical protein
VPGSGRALFSSDTACRERPTRLLDRSLASTLLVYAAGIWRMRRWVLPMGTVYAAYVIVNLILFMVRDPEPMRDGVLFGVVYAVVAIGISWGAVWVLSQRRVALT